MATCAALVGAELPDDAAEDSVDILPILLGHTNDEVRDYTLHQTISLALAIRKGDWKYLDHPGSGGNNYNSDRLKQLSTLGNPVPSAPGQLYNLAADPGETDNLYFEYPQVVKELKGKLEEFKESGRSVPRRR